jgi:hypothetical protein
MEISCDSAISHLCDYARVRSACQAPAWRRERTAARAGTGRGCGRAEQGSLSGDIGSAAEAVAAGCGRSGWAADPPGAGPGMESQWRQALSPAAHGALAGWGDRGCMPSPPRPQDRFHGFSRQPGPPQGSYQPSTYPGGQCVRLGGSWHLWRGSRIRDSDQGECRACQATSVGRR